MRSFVASEWLPKLINGFLNRQPLSESQSEERGAREGALIAVALFGIHDSGQVRGFVADRTLRDQINLEVDSLVKRQVPQNGPMGALRKTDVLVQFAPVVLRRTNSPHTVPLPDMFVMELRVRSCYDRCPLYTFQSHGNTLAWERGHGSFSKLSLGMTGVVARVMSWCDARSGGGSGDALTAPLLPQRQLSLQSSLSSSTFDSGDGVASTSAASVTHYQPPNAAPLCDVCAHRHACVKLLACNHCFCKDCFIEQNVGKWLRRPDCGCPLPHARTS